MENKPLKFSYFPGCSISEGTAKEYGISTKAVCEKLNIELKELEDWNCCGASAVHNLNDKLAVALPARNLAIAEKNNMDLIVLCAACFNRLKSADYHLKENKGLKDEITSLLEMEYEGTIKIRHFLDILYNEIGLETIQSLVKQPLQGLKLVSYYGCLLVRPPEVTQFDDRENPVILDELMEVLGAEPIRWSYKTDCCGGSLSVSKPDIVSELSHKLLVKAREAGAKCLVTACPMCFTNLEMRGKEKIPIFYFTELMGVAFGIQEMSVCLKKHLIDPRRLLKSLAILK